MDGNRINQTLKASDKEDILTAIRTIREKLPFLIDLSAEERQSLPKMGDKSRAFVNQAMQLAAQDDSFLPRSFEVSEMQQDAALAEDLYQIIIALAPLAELIEDTYLAVGSEAYSAALVVYQSAKANRRGEGLDSLLDGMARRFARKSGGTTPPDNLPAT